MMPADGADQLRKFDAVQFGAVGSPDIGCDGTVVTDRRGPVWDKALAARGEEMNELGLPSPRPQAGTQLWSLAEQARRRSRRSGNCEEYWSVRTKARVRPSFTIVQAMRSRSMKLRRLQFRQMVLTAFCGPING
jgi:hypothetical protein